jgi:glyoxylase-like metal-dependent hydrolase (beta-lactamase superfamily II)
MFVVTSQDPRNLANSYLVADRPGGAAVLVDAGTPTAPIHAAIAEHALRPRWLFVTHRHADHIAHVGEYAERYGIAVVGHHAEARACGGFDRELQGGEGFACGALDLCALHIPGHTVGHLAIRVDGKGETRVFCGDTLFRGSVGGTLGLGHTTFADLRDSVLEVLLALPAETVVHPGHASPTTVREEREGNLFVRAWRGVLALSEAPCLALDRPATLLLRAPDYDGGTKCWVRFVEGGEQAIVAGSLVVGW